MVSLKEGDIIRFTAQFQHRGQAYTGANLYAAIGQSVRTGFDPILYNEIPIVGIKADPQWELYRVTIDIQILGGFGGISPGNYLAEVKISGIPGADIIWRGPENDIVIEEPPPEAEEAQFADLLVAYSKA